MSSKNSDVPKDDLPVEDEEIATHQEAVPVPYLAGTRRIALRWISPAFGLVTQLAPDELPQKK